MTPIIRKFDVTISPDNNCLVQKTLEVDAIDPEAACDLTRFVFRNSIRIVSITAHREHRPVKTNPVTALFERLKQHCPKLAGKEGM